MKKLMFATTLAVVAMAIGIDRAQAADQFVLDRNAAIQFATLPDGVRFPEGITANPDNGATDPAPPKLPCLPQSGLGSLASWRPTPPVRFGVRGALAVNPPSQPGSRSTSSSLPSARSNVSRGIWPALRAISRIRQSARSMP